MRTLAICATLVGCAVSIYIAVPEGIDIRLPEVSTPVWISGAAGIAVLIATLAIWQIWKSIASLIAGGRRRRTVNAYLDRLVEAEGVYINGAGSLRPGTGFDDSRECLQPVSSSLTMTQSFAA